MKATITIEDDGGGAVTLPGPDGDGGEVRTPSQIAVPHVRGPGVLVVPTDRGEIEVQVPPDVARELAEYPPDQSASAV